MCSKKQIESADHLVYVLDNWNEDEMEVFVSFGAKMHIFQKRLMIGLLGSFFDYEF